ncbi:hypothetical protein UNDKW_0198 [Undibacterium sp. KW1]|nr:hypothetical protein UNDKW_0198 [Undibacterium sp. KW1]
MTMFDRNPVVLSEAKSTLKFAGNGKNIQLVSGDFHSLPFQKGSFDLVASRLAVHEAYSPRFILEQAFQVLQSNGVLAIVDVIPPSGVESVELFEKIEKTLDARFGGAETLPSWRDLMESVGFSDIEINCTRIRRTLEDRPGCAASRDQCLEVFSKASSIALKELAVVGLSENRNTVDVSWIDTRIVIIAKKSLYE